MTINTNATLKTFLIAASMRNDLADFAQDFVNSAHTRIAAKAVMYAPVAISAQAVTLPTDFGSVHSLWIMRGPMRQLTQVSQDQLALMSDTGLPGWFNVAEAMVGPAPDQTYEGRLLYRPSQAFLAADGDTNSVLTTYPFTYVHGAMAEVARFIFDPQLEASREALFGAALEAIFAAEFAKATAGAALQLTPSSRAI